MMNDIEIKNIVADYLATLDSSFEKLAHSNEGQLCKCSDWILATRKIHVLKSRHGLCIRIEKTDDYNVDNYVMDESTAEGIADLCRPINLQLHSSTLNQPFSSISNLTITKDDNPLLPPIYSMNFFLGFGSFDTFKEYFNLDKCKLDAIDQWNSKSGDTSGKSFILKTKRVFETFAKIIKRKSFVERKIHRYIYAHKDLLLPDHKRCLYEHPLYLNGEKRVADFILERSQGLAPLLIELESPNKKILRKNNEFTYEANHARGQLDEWIEYISKNAPQNASGELAFLTGNKERLIVMGTGLDQSRTLIEKKFSETVFWTYSMMLNDARERANARIMAQFRALEMTHPEPF